MHITSFRVTNYKRFLDSGTATFGPGLNILVGRNDAGKSALIEALSLRAPHAPHRSLLSIPRPGASPPSEGFVEVTVYLTGDDMTEMLAENRALTGYLTPARESSLVGLLLNSQQHGTLVNVRHMISSQPIAGQLAGAPSSGEMFSFQNEAYPSGFRPVLTGGGTGNSLEHVVGEFITRRIYAFSAERLRLGQGQITPKAELASDARNLPGVLNLLQASNPPRFNRLVGYVQEVFPHITQITTRPVDHNQAVIELWDFEPGSERSDLAIPLAASGTGIGQVLAMLYVVVTSDQPQIIAIDEPQSFLHPSALRKLFSILRSHGKHQYIVTTHSSTAISAAEVTSIHIVRREGYESTVQSVDPSSRADLSAFLSEVGARLSDVFGPDRILWVEGKTEELAIPLILREIAPELLAGMDVLGVTSTGDLDSKHAERVLRIYSRLTASSSLLPPAVAFILDPETRSEAAKEHIGRLAGGLVHFLPRRMYENYLISAVAIVDVLNAEDSGRLADGTHRHDVHAVQAWLAKHGSDSRFVGSDAQLQPLQPEWLETVHGAELLTALFNDLTKTRVAYDKVRHGIMLTRSLLASGDAGLVSLGNWIAGIARSSAPTATP